VIAGPSYTASWAFALIGLFAVFVSWSVINTSREEAIRATPSPTPTVDGAAKLIQHCGKPDLDSVIPATPQTKGVERFALLYRSAKVRAVFERDSLQSPDGWKNVKYLDPASGKQLNSQQVAKRLSCAVSIAPSSSKQQ
jgi:hypothetical protein